MTSHKIAVIKDTHLMFGFSNNIRKPAVSGQSWSKDIELKLLFISEEMMKRGITKLVVTGDLLNHSDKNSWSFRKFLMNKEVLQNIFVEKGINIYSVQGNHDMFDGLKTTNNTVFGELCNDGIINHLTENPIIIKAHEQFKIYGIDYNFTKEEQEASFQKINDLSSEHEITCVVSHTNISPNQEQFVDFTYNELSTKFPNIKVHICGHYHIGYEPKIVNGVVFINPWNMTRVVRDYQVKLDNHIPQLVFLNFNNFSTSDLNWVETVNIPHKPFVDAFNQETVSILEESEKFKFFEGVSEIDLDIIAEDVDNDQLIRLIINKNIDNISDKEKLLVKTIEYLNS